MKPKKKWFWWIGFLYLPIGCHSGCRSIPRTLESIIHRLAALPTYNTVVPWPKSCFQIGIRFHKETITFWLSILKFQDSDSCLCDFTLWKYNKQGDLEVVCNWIVLAKIIMKYHFGVIISSLEKRNEMKSSYQKYLKKASWVYFFSIGPCHAAYRSS